MSTEVPPITDKQRAAILLQLGIIMAEVAENSKLGFEVQTAVIRYLFPDCPTYAPAWCDLMKCSAHSTAFMEGNIPEDWIFFCVIGDPNDPNTNNVVSNATVENAVKALGLITAEITKRYEKLGPDAVHPI